MVEQLIRNQQVVSSSLTVGSIELQLGPLAILCCVTEDRCRLDGVHVEFPNPATPLTAPDKTKPVIGMSRPLLTIDVVGAHRNAYKSARVLDHLPFGRMVDSRHSAAAREIRVEKP